ncbi:MAG: hypothetical protein JNK04_03695 [Myxococcales bacterium]|nr:hypothetical protein [Myxococcales bacterium]
MELIPLNCNSCGAKLKVGEDTRFVTCKHCDAQLAVRHEDGAAFTDVLDAARRVEESALAIEARAAELDKNHDRLFVQGEIARIDREWDARRDAMLVRSKDGSTSVPTRTGPVVIGILMVLVFMPPVMFLFLDVELPFAWMFWLLSCGMAVGVWLGFGGMNRRADMYQRALADHEDERSRLVAELDGLAPADPPRRAKKRRRAPDEDPAE